MAKNEIKALLTADSSGFRKGVKEAAGATDDLDKRIKNMATGVSAGFAVGAIVNFGKTAVGAASDLNETLSFSQVVFRESADEIEKFADQAAKSLGLSKNEAVGAATTFAGLGKAAGLAGQELVPFSEQMVQLAVDMASAKNTSVDQAITAVGAAMRGEMEPIRTYGVLLDDATLRQQALKMKLIETTTQALTPQQKILAAQAAILAKTSDMQDDFGRTSGSLANQQKILSAELANSRAELGAAFLPVVKEVVGVLASVVAKFSELSPEMQHAVAVIALFGGGVLAAGITVRKVADAVTGFTNVLKISNSTLAVTAGVAAAAVGVYVFLAAEKAKLRQLTDEMTDAFRREQEAHDGSVRALVAARLASADLLDELDRVGLTVAEVADVIEGKAVPNMDRFKDLNDDTGIAVFSLMQQMEASKATVDAQARSNVSAGIAAKETTEAFVDEKDAAKDLTKAVKTLSTGQTDLRGAELDLADARDHLIDAQQELNEKSSEAADRVKEMESRTRALADASKSLTSAQQDQADTETVVASKTDALNRVLHGYGAASVEAVAAAKDLAGANRDLTRDQGSVADAQDRLIAAQEKLNDLRSGDAKTVPDAQRKVKRSTLDLADAQDDLKDAEDKVNVAMLVHGETSVEAAQAARDYERAGLALEDRQRSLADAQEALRVATAGYSETSKEVQGAVKDVKSAEDDLEGANLRVKDSQDKVNTAAATYQGVVSGMPADSQVAVAALGDVKEANRLLAEKIDAVKTAQQGVKDKTAELNEGFKDTSSVKDYGDGLRDVERAALAVQAAEKSLDDQRRAITAAQATVDAAFTARMGSSAGYAEYSRSQRNTGTTTPSGGNVSIFVSALDAKGAGDAVVAALSDWSRRNGSVPIRVSG